MRRDFIISCWAARVSLPSRAAFLSTTLKMSLVSFTTEELIVVGVDSSPEMVEATQMLLGVIAPKEDNGEDVTEEDGAGPNANALWGAWMEVAKEAKATLEMGVGYCFTEAKMWTESAPETR